jgi:N-acyl homoserine lactone hydrolase
MPEIEILLPGFSINTDQGTLGLCTVTLIHGDKLTLVDVGHFGRRTMLVETLQAHNLTPEDIGRVILTHAHWDHSQNTDLFSNAEIVISKQELEYSRNPWANDFAVAKYFADTLSRHTVTEVSGETELEKGIGTFDTPGHTAGHQSVLVETANGVVCLGGDAISDAGALKRGLPAFVFWSVDQAQASLKKIAASASTIYPGHDRPFSINGEEFEYLVDAPTIKVSGFLDSTRDLVSVELGLPPRFEPRINPDAR